MGQWAPSPLLSSATTFPRGEFRSVQQFAGSITLDSSPSAIGRAFTLTATKGEDVVRHRENYLKTMVALRESHQPPPACCDDPPRVQQEEDEEKKLVLLYHNKSIYNSNEGQTWMWGEEERPALLPKTRGVG